MPKSGRDPRSRAAIYAAACVVVGVLAAYEFQTLRGPDAGIIAAGAAVLVLGVAIGLAAAAILEYRGRRSHATLVVATMAYLAGPIFAFAAGDPAAAIVAPLIGFSLLLPYLAPGLPTLLGAGITVAVLATDLTLMALGHSLQARTEQDVLDSIISVGVAAGVMVSMTIAQRRDVERSAGRYADLFNRMPVAAFRSAPDGRFVAANDALLRLFGFASSRDLQRSLVPSLYVDPGAREQLWHTALRDGHAEGEVEIRQADGKARWVRFQLHARGSGRRGRRPYVEGAVEDISAERRMAAWRQQREEVGAALKSMSPEASVEDHAATMCERIASSSNFRYAAIFSIGVGANLRLEGGWLAGRRLDPQAVDAPEVLREINERLAWGPYVDMLDNPRTELGRMSVAMGVRDVAYVPLVVEDTRIGLLVAGTGSGDRQHLTEHLAALTDYANVATSLIAPELMARRKRERAQVVIAGVIDQRQFYPVFQPIVRLEDRAVIGYEALTRFGDGTPPEDMFRMAREAGLELELETATLAAAMRAAPRLGPGLFLDLNASPDLVCAVEPLRSHLEKWGDRVVIEITEHAEVADYARLRTAITALGPNVVLAVDDAGAGFASLRHILELSPRFVKLDRQFVREIESDPARQALAAGMAHFAKEARMTLIAEGVETEAESSTLQRLGVPAAQGYLFGRPKRRIPREVRSAPARAATRATPSAGSRRPRPRIVRVA